jgi:pimeloyl-ACP methyl ester carboxylesterase
MKRLFLCGVFFWLAGCQPVSPVQIPTALPTLANGEFTIPMDDGLLLSAALTGNGELLVIMANGGLSLKDDWDTFPETIASHHHSVLTWDYRGLGKTGGVMGNLQSDMNAIMRFMRARGFSKFVCLGVSMGGAACEMIASEPGMAGMVLVSGVTPRDFYPGLDLHLNDIHFPVLLFVSEDEGLLPSNQWLYDQIPGPDKELVVIPGGVHVPFYTDAGPAIVEKILKFIDRLH